MSISPDLTEHVVWRELEKKEARERATIALWIIVIIGLIPTVLYWAAMITEASMDELDRRRGK